MGSAQPEARVSFGKRLTWSDRSPWFEDDEGALFGLEPLIRCRGASTRVAKGVEDSKDVSWTQPHPHGAGPVPFGRNLQALVWLPSV